MRHTY